MGVNGVDRRIGRPFSRRRHSPLDWVRVRFQRLDAGFFGWLLSPRRPRGSLLGPEPHPLRHEAPVAEAYSSDWHPPTWHQPQPLFPSICVCCPSSLFILENRPRISSISPQGKRWYGMVSGWMISLVACINKRSETRRKSLKSAVFKG